MTAAAFQIITLIAVVLSACAAVVAAVAAWINRRQIQDVHLLMNSRLDQLVETTERLARARGASEALADDKLKRATAASLVLDQERLRDS